MKPIIRAAVDSGRPPLELLLDQPNRKRTKWDGKLIKALYLNEAFEVEGYPIWVEESPDITFQAKRKIIRSLAAVEKAQETHQGKKKPEKGVRFYAEAKLKPGAKWPSRAEWEKRRSGKAEVAETGIDSKARVDAAEQRAKERVDSDPELKRIVEEMKAKRKSNSGSING